MAQIQLEILGEIFVAGPCVCECLVWDWVWDSRCKWGGEYFSSLNATDAKNNQQAHSYYSATRHAKLL